MTEKLDSTIVRRREAVVVDGVKESRSVSNSDSVPSSLDPSPNVELRELSAIVWIEDWALQFTDPTKNPLNTIVNAINPA